VGFGNDLTREWSFDQNVIHEHVLQIGIIAWLVILSIFLWFMFITLYAYDRKKIQLIEVCELILYNKKK
jgi:hypothetical protein